MFVRAVPLILTAAALPVAAETIVFDKWDPTENKVTFESRAPAELLIANTHAVNGRLILVDEFIGSASGVVSVETGSFFSGVPLRDETMRSPEWLNSASFPVARFYVNQLIADETVLGVSTVTDVVARGTLELRGIRQDYTIAAELLYLPPHFLRNTDARLSIEGEFVIDHIGDFGMRIPRRYLARISPEIVVSFSLSARGRPLPQPGPEKPVVPSKLPETTPPVITDASSPER